MELSHKTRLTRGIILLSVSDDWVHAKEEWVLDHIYFTESFRTCLCGHYPIREICVLRNTVNHCRTVVGNVCVNKFMGIESERLFSSFRRIRQSLSNSLNQDTIDYAYDKGWINNWEMDFYCNTIRKRNLTEKQMAKKTQINEKIKAKLLGGNNEQVQHVVPGATQFPGNTGADQHNERATGAGRLQYPSLRCVLRHCRGRNSAANQTS